MPNAYDWNVPPLDSWEQRLADAYVLVGRRFDDLPYTEEFKRICALMGAEDNDEARQLIYRQLRRLRQSGRLPRLGLLIE
ncbi:MAG: hypothetical protein ABI353_07695 [Isosphaeraceae bacterium]